MLDRFRFGVTVEDAAWDEDEQRLARRAPTAATSPPTSWSPAPAGSRSPSCRRSRASSPSQGEVFHSARWNHDYDLTGKRVAVIGTGASAIQIVPEVAKQVDHLDVYQRTAPWVMPRTRPRLHARSRGSPSGTCRSSRRPTARASTGAASASCPAFTVNPRLAAPARKLALKNIERRHRRPRAARGRDAGLPDRLQAHPDLQRLLPRARPRPRRPRHRRDRADHADRHRHRATAPSARSTRIIVATGFYTTEQPIAAAHQGSRRPHPGRRVARERAWRRTRAPRSPASPTCSRSSAPTPASGHSSMVFIIESQIAYIRLRAAADGRARASPPSSRRRRRRRRGTTTCSAGCSAPCGAPAAARAGTSTPTAATPRCGRAPRSSSAGCCAASTPTSTS